MGNEESLPTDNTVNQNVLFDTTKLKSDINTKERLSKSPENSRKMSMGLLQKLPIFSYASDGGSNDKKSLSDNCSLSSDEVMSEDSPVTPPGPDLSHLSDSEREHIANVIARAKNIERDEDERLREIENELNFIEEAASSRSSKHSLTPDGNHCVICSKSINQTDATEIQTCVNCHRKVCGECGMYNSDSGTTFAEFLCSICQKKRHLILSSGMWFHGLCHDPFPKTLSIQDLLAAKKSNIERTSSYSQYEEIFERPHRSEKAEKLDKTSTLKTKMKSLLFHHNSTPEIRSLVPNRGDENLENEKINDPYQQQINPEYQEVKNRYLHDSNFGRSKSRRQHFHNQIPSEFPDPQEPMMYNVPFQKMPPYLGYNDSERELNNYYEYQIDDEYNFPLVDDIINSSLSSDDEEYTNYDKSSYYHASDSKFNEESKFPLLEDVLDETSSSNHDLSQQHEEDSNTEDLAYSTYSNSTFKPNYKYNKEVEHATDFDNFDRNNSLLAYYDQMDNQFEDYFYSEADFRAIENFQLYNNELIRRCRNEDNYFARKMEQSDTDSDIAKFAATIASDTANLTNQTFNYEMELANTYPNRFSFQDDDINKVEDTNLNVDQTPEFTNALLNSHQYSFKKSILSPILDLSPNSSKAEEPKAGISDTVLGQPKALLVNCDHDSDEECQWCYRDSSSNVSKENIFSSSISSTSSSNSSISTSNETVNNKSKSQLKRCQNYENISGLSESASADTLEDNNSMKEFLTDDNIEIAKDHNKETNFKKSLSLSKQSSIDIMAADSEEEDLDSEDRPMTEHRIEVPTINLTSSSCKSLVPFTPTTDKHCLQEERKHSVDRNFTSPFAYCETINPQLPEQTQALSLTNPIGKEAKFSSINATTSEIVNEQFNEQTTSATTVSNSIPNKKALENFPVFAGYNNRTGKNSLLNKLCVQLQVPTDTKNRKAIINEEILLVTQIKRQHLKEFAQIQNVELQLNLLRNIEKQQMNEIQEKMAEIQNAKSVLSYPRLSKSRYFPNYYPHNNDLNYYYYYLPSPRTPYRYQYPQYYYQNPYHYRQDHMYKYEPTNFDDQRSSYSIYSSPQFLGYGNSYPRELKYNGYYYTDPVHNPTRGFSRSTDQIAMHNNYLHYPLEMSHSDQGLFNMSYNYPVKMEERFPCNIDIELMQKEQRVLELEREIELRKKQIEETIRYQEELLQLAELNNVNVNDYKNTYHLPNNQQIMDYDLVNNYYINEKHSSSRQYPEDTMNIYYPYDDLTPQFNSYYDNLYSENDVKDNVCYAEPIFQQDPYYPQQYMTDLETGNAYGQQTDLEIVNSFDQHQRRYSSKSYLDDKRPACNASTQDCIDYPMQMVKEIDKSHNAKGNYQHVRPLSGEYENVVSIDSENVENKTNRNYSISKSKGSSQNPETTKPVRSSNIPTKRLLLMRDSKEKNLRGNGVGMRIIGGQLCSDGHLGAFVEQIFPGSMADRLQDQIKEGDEIIEWNGVSLVGKTFEEVRSILKNDSDEIEFLVRVGSISKSPENSKENLNIIDENHVKSLSSVLETMNIKENNNQIPITNKKENSSKIEEIMTNVSSNENATNRRSQSIKRQRAEEYEAASATQNTSKSSTKRPSMIESSHAELDCGSPQIARQEMTVNSSVSHRKESVDANQLNSEAEKDENDERSSQTEKVLGEIQVIINFDDYDQSLTVHVAKAKNMLPMDLNGLADPFVKVRLHPDPTEDPDFNRQTRYMPNTLNPEWQQTVVFMNILKRSLRKRVLDLSVWDFDRLKSNDFMGQALINLANKQVLDAKPHWYTLTEMKEVDIPGLRQPAHRKVDSKVNNKSKSGNKSSKEIKNSRDETVNILHSPYISNSNTDFPPPLPNSNVNVISQNQLPEIKIIKSLEQTSPISNKPSSLKPVPNTPLQMSPENINNLFRTDTADSKSSNSSSVTTDFLSEEQREIVRKWLGPGQLLMLSYTQRVDKVGNLPDDSLVVAELYLSLRKIADEDVLIVTASSLRNVKAKAIPEVYIKLYLMYSEQQLSRVMKRKTKLIALNEDSNFNETFTFKTQLEGMLLQVSLWSCGKGLNVHKMVGEAVIHLDDIEFVKKNSTKDVSGWYKLLKPDI